MGGDDDIDVDSCGKWLLVVGCVLVGDDNNEESGSAKSGLRTSISPVYRMRTIIRKDEKL